MREETRQYLLRYSALILSSFRPLRHLQPLSDASHQVEHMTPKDNGRVSYRCRASNAEVKTVKPPRFETAHN
jgi:hypothetical protein